MAKSWDWQRVNWKTFEEAIQDIRNDIGEAETAINNLADDDSVPDDLHDALSNITSTLVGLSFVVNLHHQHVAELEGPRPPKGSPLLLSARRRRIQEWHCKEVRFRLGSPEGQYSMLWRTWVQGDEVYLAPRTMARVVKLSLHSSRIWRWSFVAGSPLDREIERDRAQRKWLQPSPFIPGWVAGPSVMFPYSPVPGWGRDPVETTKSVSWLEPPGERIEEADHEGDFLSEEMSGS